MFNFDYIIKEHLKELNPNGLSISDHPYQILIIGSSRSGKTNILLNLINHKPVLIKFICTLKIQMNQDINY